MAQNPTGIKLNNEINYYNAIKDMIPDCSGKLSNFHLDPYNLDTLKWVWGPGGEDKKNEPTTQEIEDALVALQKKYDDELWLRNRQGASPSEGAGYPAIGVQLEKIYDDGIDEWKKDIKAVKDRWPKDNSGPK